MWKVLFL